VVDGGQMMSDNGENRRWLLLRSEKEVQEKGFCLVLGFNGEDGARTTIFRRKGIVWVLLWVWG